MKQLILASSSPRRRQIMQELGLTFQAIPPRYFEETMDGMSPEELVCHNALGKAREVSGHCQDSIVIGCDTVIVFGNEILGKPLTSERARFTLSSLSGHSHSVLSGLAVIDVGLKKELVGHEESVITFRRLTKDETEKYIESGEPLDKAGAYGIQGRGELFVKRIEGSFSNVVGLPKALLMNFLDQLNLEL